MQLPAMNELEAHNHLLGDPAALASVWEDCGYWLFRDVLPQGPVNRTRRKYLEVLVGRGVIDAQSHDALWNGTDLGSFPDKVEELYESRVWESFVADPCVHSFFRRILGEDPFWIPITEYRVTPPIANSVADPFEGRHQDGFYNRGIPFRVCWIPLMAISDVVGGLALAPGLHKHGYFHDLDRPPRFEIPADAIPDTAWARADYSPGDVVIFDIGLPHTGLPNRSDRFRMSMDIRMMPASGPTPTVGKILAISPGSVIVTTEAATEEYVIDDTTYVRGSKGRRLMGAEILDTLQAGDAIIVAHEGRLATVVRPAR